MNSYVAMLALYYLFILLLQLPWWMILGTTLRRMQRHGGRLRRFQFEGASLIVLGTLAKWIVFDTHLGVDPLQVKTWSPWFSRGEVGLFLIGLLLFGLGFFLEHAPRTGFPPWPPIVKMVCMTAILSGTALGAAGWILFNYQWFELPWDFPRVVFTLGCWPFAVGFWIWTRRALR